MYIRRKIFSKTDSSTEKKNNKAEVVTAGIGLGATLGKTVKDYKDLDIDVLSHRKGARKRELAQANEILKDVNTIRNNGFYVNKFRGSENHWFNRKTGTGQLEAANNAMLYHDKANDLGLHKIARKQLKSAEKHAKRQLKCLMKIYHIIIDC